MSHPIALCSRLHPFYSFMLGAEQNRSLLLMPPMDTIGSNSIIPFDAHPHHNSIHNMHYI
jgi:hypothetical protein